MITSENFLVIAQCICAIFGTEHLTDWYVLLQAMRRRRPSSLQKGRNLAAMYDCGFDDFSDDVLFRHNETYIWITRPAHSIFALEVTIAMMGDIVEHGIVCHIQETAREELSIFGHFV